MEKHNKARIGETIIDPASAEVLLQHGIPQGRGIDDEVVQTISETLVRIHQLLQKLYSEIRLSSQGR